MTDEKTLARVDAPLRAVIRNGHDKLYYVYEYVLGFGYSPVLPLRGYAHSTSAYAQLGRITNRENQKALLQLNGV